MSITTLALAKAHAYVVGNFQDSTVQLYLDAAEQSASVYLARTLHASAEDLAQGIADAPIALETALTAINAARATAQALTDFDLRCAQLAALDDAKATALRDFRMAMAGMVIVPPITSAVLLIFGHLYENRQDNLLASGITVAVELPLGSRALLQPYRVGLGV